MRTIGLVTGSTRLCRQESAGEYHHDSFLSSIIVREQLTNLVPRFVSSSFLSGSPLALVVSVAMAWLCVAWSNAKNRYFHYFTVVFFEIVVLVQSGNFSCVNA
mmetsp:Transcript_55540/g.146489  ORF Transcript_55540/g.146489 Transcript_55540/m.146489 type:complete len:103 (-) Transcript_55540:547-855(-)